MRWLNLIGKNHEKKLKDLVYAANESDYSQLKTKAFKLANTQFIKYSGIIVIPCGLCTYKMIEYLHLANTTNNCLECHHHRLKDLISQSCMLSEMFNHVLTFSSTHALEYSQKCFVESFPSVQLNLINT